MNMATQTPQAAPSHDIEFFKTYGDFSVRLKFLGTDDSITVEELYQAFKARMSAETTGE